MKEMRLISQWSKRSFRKRKRKGLRQMFTYKMTLGESIPLEGSLANEIQLGWWQVPIRGSPSQFEELGIFLISDQGGSWIRIMSKWNRVSSIVFRTIEFLQTFCEKIFRFRTIIVGWSRSHGSGGLEICFHKSLHTFWYAIPYWIDVSKRNTNLNWPGDPLCSWSTWMNEGRVHPSWFLT